VSISCFLVVVNAFIPGLRSAQRVSELVRSASLWFLVPRNSEIYNRLSTMDGAVLALTSHASTTSKFMFLLIQPTNPLATLSEVYLMNLCKAVTDVRTRAASMPPDRWFFEHNVASYSRLAQYIARKHHCVLSDMKTTRANMNTAAICLNALNQCWKKGFTILDAILPAVSIVCGLRPARSSRLLC